MSAFHSLILHSPLKTVFWENRRYLPCLLQYLQTHTMATHHGSSGQYLDRDINVTREAHKATGTDVEDTQDFHPVETDHFEKLEHNNPTRLTAITRELDDLCQQVQNEEEQPSEALNHIEKELQRLSILLNLPAHTEPLGEVIKHYTNTLCSAQKKPT